METECTINHESLFGSRLTTPKGRNAYEYIKKCSENNYSDFNEKELNEAARTIADIGAKSYGEDKEALNTVISILKSDKITDTQTLFKLSYVFAIGTYHYNDTPLELTNFVKEKIINKDLSDLISSYKKIEKSCLSRSNKCKGLINLIDFWDFMRNKIPNRNEELFCEKFASICNNAITEDVLPLFERLLRICSLPQNREFLKSETVQKALSIIFDTELYNNMSVLSSGILFATKTCKHSFVNLDKIVECCTKQIDEMQKKPTNHFFEDIFYFIDSTEFDKEDSKRKEFINTILQKFFSVLHKIVLYEDVTNTFMYVRKYMSVSSFETSFRELIDIDKTPFVDNDETDKANISRLFTISTILDQLFPAQNLPATLFSNENMLKSIINAFCNGISKLKKQENILSILNAFSAAFRLIFIMRPDTQKEIYAIYKQLLDKELSQSVTDIDNLSGVNLAPLALEKRCVINSLCMIFCAFLTCWNNDDAEQKVWEENYLMGFCLLNFFSDSVESSIFIRTVFQGKNLTLDNKIAIFSAGLECAMVNDDDDFLNTRIFKIMNSLSETELNNLFEMNAVLGDLVVSQFTNAIDTYIAHENSDGNDDDDDDFKMVNTESRDAKILNISNLVFKSKFLRDSFKKNVINLMEKTPEILYELPLFISNNFLNLLGEESNDYIEHLEEQKKAEEEQSKKGDDGKKEEEVKDYILNEEVFLLLREMGLDRYQVQIAANRVKSSSPEEIATAYFENSERINSEADKRKVLDQIKKEKEQAEAEAKKKEEEEKQKAKENKNDDDDDDDAVKEEVFDFPRYINITFNIAKLLPTLPAKHSDAKYSFIKLGSYVISRYGTFSKDNFIAILRFMTLKFDPELKSLFTMRTIGLISRIIAVRKQRLNITQEDADILTSAVAKINASFNEKFKALAYDIAENDEETTFSAEDFTELFNIYHFINCKPEKIRPDDDNVEVLVTTFPENIFSFSPLLYRVSEESMAEMCIATLNIIAKHWKSFMTAKKGTIEKLLDILSGFTITVRNTPIIAKADLTPLMTILSNAGRENLSQDCINNLCYIFYGFTSQTADDVIFMIYRICEAFAQFGERTDVFNACFDLNNFFENYRAFIIAGGIALDVGSNGEGFMLKRGYEQEDFLKSNKIASLTKDGEVRRKEILNGVIDLCNAGNEVAEIVGAYLWLSLPTVINDERLSKYISKFISGGYTDLIGTNESLVLKNNIKSFFTAITKTETSIDLKIFVEFVMHKIIKTIRHKAQREAFMSSFLEFNEATGIINNLIELTHPDSWLFIRVIINIHCMKSESVLKFIPDISKKVSEDKTVVKDIKDMTEDEQIEYAKLKSIGQDGASSAAAAASASGQNVKNPDRNLEFLTRIISLSPEHKIKQPSLIELAEVAAQRRFNVEEEYGAFFTNTSSIDLNLDKFNSDVPIIINYMTFTVKLLYTIIINNVFALEPVKPVNDDSDEKISLRIAYEEEVETVKANYSSFIEELPPDMKGEFQQNLEIELQNLRKKYNIKDEDNGEKNSYGAVLEKATQIHRNAGQNNYYTNKVDGFQNTQSPAENEIPIFTPEQMQSCVDLFLKENNNVALELVDAVFPCLLLLALCKPTRDILYDKLIELFAVKVNNSNRFACAMINKLFNDILILKPKPYGAESILLNGKRVKLLLESLAKLVDNASVGKRVYEMIIKLTQRIAPQPHIDTQGSNNFIACMELSKETLESIINCKFADIRDVEDITLKLAGSKENMIVLSQIIHDKLVTLISEETNELNKISDLIIKKEITGDSDIKDKVFIEKSHVLETQLKLFCRITSVTMRGENLSKNRSSQYLGNYVIHCNFDDLGLNDLCDSVEKVLDNIEEMCPELAPEKKKNDDDDDVIIVEPPQKVPADDTANPYNQIINIITTHEEVLAKHRKQLIEELTNNSQEQYRPYDYISQDLDFPPFMNYYLPPQRYTNPPAAYPPPFGAPPQFNQPLPQPPQQQQQQQIPQPSLNNYIANIQIPLQQQQQQQQIPQPPQQQIPLPPQQQQQQQQQIPQPPQQQQIPLSPQQQQQQQQILQSQYQPPQFLFQQQYQQQQILQPQYQYSQFQPQQQYQQQPPLQQQQQIPLPPPPQQQQQQQQHQPPPQQQIIPQTTERIEDLQRQLSETDDVDELSDLLEELLNAYRDRDSTRIQRPISLQGRNTHDFLQLLNYVDGVINVIKFVTRFTGNRDELFQEIFEYIHFEQNQFEELLRPILSRATPAQHEMIMLHVTFGDELSRALIERARDLGIEYNRFREGGDDRIIVKRKPFTNVIVALTSFFNIVFITETSSSRLEYEKRHENEAEESNLLCMSNSTSSLEGGTRSLFKEHEKLFSAILRGDLNLMNGPLKSLVINLPSLVSFEDKERWFRNEVEKEHGRHRGGGLRITVNRMNLFEDSFRQMNCPIEDLKGRLRVDFKGEGGIDAGGLMREWFRVIALEIANPQYGLFKPSDDSAIQPNPKASFLNEGAIEYFRFVGRIVGKTLWDRQLLDVHFTRSFYKQILGRDVNAKDMESVDHKIYESLRLIYDNHITEDDYIYFTETVHQVGKTEEVPFIPGGEDIPVTDSNKASFINLKVQFLLVNSIKNYLDSFMRGFNEFIPQDLIAPFTENQLELLISGMPTIDIKDMRKHTMYKGYSESSEQVVWFWKVVNGFNEEEKAMLLQFITGSSKVPTGGFANLTIKIMKAGNPSKLPEAHTCFNQLDLPVYLSFEELKAKLTTAVSYGCVGFGFG